MITHSYANSKKVGKRVSQSQTLDPSDLFQILHLKAMTDKKNESSSAPSQPSNAAPTTGTIAVQPAAIPSAPTAQNPPPATPQPKPDPPPAPQKAEVKRSSKFEFELKNPPSLESVSKRYNLVIPPSSTAPAPAASSFFQRFDVTRRLGVNRGLEHTIDVQPDFRFIINYICINVIELYATIDVAANPFVSPTSLVAYCLSCYVTVELLFDTTIRGITSAYAAEYGNNVLLSDLLEHLSLLNVPKFLVDLLLPIAPTFDARRTGCMFIPTSQASTSTEMSPDPPLPPLSVNGKEICQQHVRGCLEEF